MSDEADSGVWVGPLSIVGSYAFGNKKVANCMGCIVLVF
jgi:hypothetical protein